MAENEELRLRADTNERERGSLAESAGRLALEYASLEARTKELAAERQREAERNMLLENDIRRKEREIEEITAKVS